MHVQIHQFNIKNATENSRASVTRSVGVLLVVCRLLVAAEPWYRLQTLPKSSPALIPTD